MGYAQELERRMSGFSNFAVSFSIICILSGAINSLARRRRAQAAPPSASAGRSAASYPASLRSRWARSPRLSNRGRLYHWSSILGNRFHRLVDGLAHLLGLVTVLGAINVGTWGFFSGAIAPWFPAISVDTSTAEGFRNQILFMAIITGAQALINHFGIKLTAKLTDFSGYLIFATTIVLTLACFAFAEHWDFTRCGRSTTSRAIPLITAPTN